MAFSLQEAREKRNALGLELRDLANTEKHPEWNSELDDQFNAKTKEYEDLEGQISRYEKVLDMMSTQKTEEAAAEAADKHLQDNGDNAATKATAMFAKWLKGGDMALSAEDWQVVRNTMSTTTDSEGGYLAPDSTVASILETMKAYGGMRQVSTVITTGTGNTMNYPTSDGTAEMGEILAQNATASDADVSFGVQTLDVFKFSSKVVTVPIELIQDSNVDIAAFVNNRLATRLGRSQNYYFTLGTGVNQPKGIVTAATTGKTGTTGETTTAGIDDLIDLEHSIDPAYRAAGTCRWMFNDTTLKTLRKLKDTTGRPIWMPGDLEGITGGIPATLLNHPFTINQSMPDMAASAKSIAFGDFSKYVIRDVMAMSFMRFTDSAYAKNGQVGFLAFMRAGGNFMDVGGAVKLFVNAAS